MSIHGRPRSAASFCLTLTIIWTSIIAIITVFTLYVHYRNTIQDAEAEARNYFILNYYYRALVARFGGVYVSTDKVQPNPYLTVPYRDVTTSDGKSLTLVNPAYLTRMVFDEIMKSTGTHIVSKLTSLKPTYPGNAPDDWERSVLISFEKHGVKERSQVTTIDGKPYLRLLSRFIVDPPCLKCHAHQGYKVHDVRGGISISVPLEHLLAGERKTQLYVTSGYAFLWVLGCGGISLATRRRARYERQLVESEEKFRTVCDWTQDWEYWTGNNGEILYVSPSCEEITGYPPAAFMADKELIFTVVHPDDRAGFDSHCQSAFSEISGPGQIEFRIFRRDGEVRWIQHRCRPVRLGEFNKGRRVSNRDITDQKRQAEEHRLLEQQMMHTQKLESLGVLAGGIAHDFNNILTSIVGNADIALMRINPESVVAENLKKIEQGAMRATDLAKQLLAYSGKGKFLVEPLDVNRLIEDMVHLLEVSISKKAILRFHLGENLPTVEGDATQLRQVIMNMVINASDAIGDRSGVIAISTGCIDCNSGYLKGVWFEEQIPEGLYLYMEIADSGCGMDKETIARIFDPFFTTKFTGRGLGMAAVLGIVRGHNGAIKVYSEPGKGTTFKVLLPASERPAALYHHDDEDSAWQGEGKVLLVDDEETVCAIGSDMLTILGFNPITAPDGREALSCFRATRDIRCVILDLTMPHMDGEQTFRELRMLDPNVKVIMSSGYNEREINQRFAGKGLAGFIQKPYTLTVLRETLQGALATEG